MTSTDRGAQGGEQGIAEGYLSACEQENRELRAICQLVLDFHAADTKTFVAKHGTGFTTRMLCDRLRAALAAEVSS